MMEVSEPPDGAPVRSSLLYMTLGERGSDTIRQALEIWGSFPVAQEPRPLVLLSERVRPLGFPDGTTKEAFLNGAIEAESGFPRQVLEAMRLSGRRSSEAVLIMSDATLEEFEFKTDRGQRLLPAWRVRAQGIHEPIWVLDPAIEGLIWKPTDKSMAHLYHGGSSASTGGDNCTITMAFVGSPVEYADYPDAHVYETSGAVAIEPVVVDKLAPGQARLAIGARREVTVVLSEPLGAKVLLDQQGSPVVVES
jgi:hypothetical protein